MNRTNANPEYKDRLFKAIFGREEHKEWTLSLYNAVSGKSYEDPSCIELNTIQNFLWLSMKNDVSFLVESSVNVYEHQSTYNPNMPLRMLEYLAMHYNRHVEETHQNKYGTTQVILPVPKLVVFYNGEKDGPDEMTLQLADAFDAADRSVSDVQVRVRMININYGRNAALMQKCRPLGDYAWFVHEVRSNNKERGMELSEAIREAIHSLANDSPIKPYLTAHESEVSDMLATEYREEEAMKAFMEEGERKGETKGLKKGRREGRQEAKAGLQQLLERLKAQGASDAEILNAVTQYAATPA